MKSLINSLLLFCLLGSSALAQETWPPNNAVLLGLDPVVTLRWPGSPKGRYYVQVYASQAEVYSKEVTGNSLRLPLNPGPRYRWQVSRVESGGFLELVPTQSFQLSSETEFNFSGKDGKDGRHAARGERNIGAQGQHGQDGSEGSPGPDIQVTLERAEEAILLSIQGPSTTQKFLLLPGTPISIATRGGKGGDGGLGGHGGPGFFQALSNQHYAQAASYPPGIGGDGGAGGHGGRGGNVTIRSSGVDARQLITIDNRGGPGGRGGDPGAGGAAPVLPSAFIGQVPPYFLSSAPPGRPGLSGEPGVPGQVFSR